MISVNFEIVKPKNVNLHDYFLARTCICVNLGSDQSHASRVNANYNVEEEEEEGLLLCDSVSIYHRKKTERNTHLYDGKKRVSRGLIR